MASRQNRFKIYRGGTQWEVKAHWLPSVEKEKRLGQKEPLIGCLVML